jgi:hypothetical protein
MSVARNRTAFGSKLGGRAVRLHSKGGTQLVGAWLSVAIVSA